MTKAKIYCHDIGESFKRIEMLMDFIVRDFHSPFAITLLVKNSKATEQDK
jgi:hypothetical protein